MNIRLSHARGVVGEAVEVLVGSGGTRDRLRLAATILHGILPNDFEGYLALKDKFDTIHSALSKVQSKLYGSYDATIDKMSGPAMSKLTAQILELDRAIREEK
ncbi:hypothetical protein [Pararhizobium polonicum]|nr:hypothetical protein [Pararhizobium polonicum]